jgi:peptidyl-prolyl cis-trans isomerase SurA
MKKLFLILILNYLASVGYGQNANDVIISIDNKPITAEEFKYIYEKNNGKDADYSEKSLKEYLKLYTNFKLKVAQAREQKIDTIETLNEELDGYKKQLTNSYISEKEISPSLIREIEERQKYDVRFKHIFVNLPPNLSDSFLILAKNRIQKIEQDIKNGKSFDAVAKEQSDDSSNKEKGGDLGYFSAPLPEGFYELENALYTLPVGKVSGLIQTKAGYHIIMVTDKRPAKGMLKVAHILIKKGNDASSAQLKINDLFTRLKSGENFEALVSSASEDGESAKNGGQLPAFGINTYDPVFEDAAFAIKNDGELSSTIVETKSGYHIIKRIGVPSGIEAANIKKGLENKTKKGERFELALQSLIRDVKISGKSNENKALLSKFTSTLDEEFFLFKWEPNVEKNISASSIYSIGDYNFSVAEFAQYCKKNTRSRLKFEREKTNIEPAVTGLFNEFTEEKSLLYEQKLLEIKYPEFRSLMREYEEGILLFEVTKKNIWDKASQDTIGLIKFFESKKNDYVAEAKATLVNYVISSDDQALAEKIRKFALKKDAKDVLKKFNKDKSVVVIFAEEVIEKSSSKSNLMEWKEKAQTALVKNEDTGGYLFSMIKKITPQRNKTLKEARGYVVAEYQDKLEKEWVENLSKKYVTQLNEVNFKKMIKQ